MTPNFVLDTNPTTDWPVKVKLPRAGEFVEFGFRAEIKLMAEHEYVALLASVAQTGAEQDDAIKQRSLEEVLADNARILPQLVLAWDVKDASGVAVPIDALPSMLVGPYGRPLSVALYHSINEIRFGVVLGDEKQPGASEGN